MRSLFRHGDVGRLDHLEKKGLSSFSFGTNGFLLAPEMSNRVLRCIVELDDVSGLVDHMTTSSPSVKFLIDNSRMGAAAWACEASCFANNPQADLQEGLGEMEIKCETIRYIECATSDLLQDAAFNVERWLFQKVSEGFRNTINAAILLGDGVGKPLGFLAPHAGIPICDTSANTPAGQFSWQDMVQLKFEIPMSWQDGCVYVMNQKTAALLMTMSDATTRPLFSALPERGPGFTFAGSPIIIAAWMPDVAPGSTPILFGNLKRTYTMIDRQATTLQIDPFSAGWCRLFKFEARCGGAPTCPNASRLSRIR
jgi:HK97 family phage major capsid protein